MESNWVPFLMSFAGPSKPFYGYKLELREDDLKITLSGVKPPYYNEENLPYGFVEGLWHYDCGELWLCNPENGRYIEFNLAPDGCRWACVFALPRLRDGEIPPPVFQPESMLMETGWFSSFTVTWSEIERCLGTRDNLIGNVTIIEGGCADVNPALENLHSIVELGAVDFHRPQDWIPLVELVDPPLPLEEDYD